MSDADIHRPLVRPRFVSAQNVKVHIGIDPRKKDKMKKIVCILAFIVLAFTTTGACGNLLVIDVEYLPLNAGTHPSNFSNLSSISLGYYTNRILFDVGKYTTSELIGHRLDKETGKLIPIFKSYHIYTIEGNYCLYHFSFADIFVGFNFPFSWSSEFHNARGTFGFQFSIVINLGPQIINFDPQTESGGFLKISIRRLNLGSVEFTQTTIGFGAKF